MNLKLFLLVIVGCNVLFSQDFYGIKLGQSNDVTKKLLVEKGFKFHTRKGAQDFFGGELGNSGVGIITECVPKSKTVYNIFISYDGMELSDLHSKFYEVYNILKNKYGRAESNFDTTKAPFILYHDPEETEKISDYFICVEWDMKNTKITLFMHSSGLSLRYADKKLSKLAKKAEEKMRTEPF